MRLRLLSVCVIIAGWLGVPGGSQAQDGKVLHVALAGTMEQVISRQIGPAFTAATGYTFDVTRQSSVLLANRIHGTQSYFNNDIEAVRAGKLPWYELMQRPGLVPRCVN
jgi:ABC-type molybdate transport system substrate-binding protein